MSGCEGLFPTFLKLAGRDVLVVGGGVVATTKIPPLLRAGARVTVVAPQIRPEIERMDVALVRDAFRPDMLDGVWFVVAAASPDVNRDVAAAAEARRVFVNAVDDPRHASAYAGGVLERAGVMIAVSTNGHAPALAGLLREALDAVLPEDLERWMAEAQSIRRRWFDQGVPMADRRPQLLQALNALYGQGASNGRSEPTHNS